jgi:hypothetical protein
MLEKERIKKEMMGVIKKKPGVKAVWIPKLGT